MRVSQTCVYLLLLGAVLNFASCKAKEPVGKGQPRTANPADVHILKCLPQATEDAIIREQGAHVTWRSWDTDYSITFGKKYDNNGNDITPAIVNVPAQKTGSWDTSSASINCNDKVTGTTIKGCYFKYKISSKDQNCPDPGVHIIPGSLEAVN